MSLNQDYENMKQNMRNTGLLTEDEIEEVAEDVLKSVPITGKDAGDVMKRMFKSMEGADE